MGGTSAEEQLPEVLSRLAKAGERAATASCLGETQALAQEFVEEYQRALQAKRQEVIREAAAANVSTPCLSDDVVAGHLALQVLFLRRTQQQSQLIHEEAQEEIAGGCDETDLEGDEDDDPVAHTKAAPEAWRPQSEGGH